MLLGLCKHDALRLTEADLAEYGTRGRTGSNGAATWCRYGQAAMAGAMSDVDGSRSLPKLHRSQRFLLAWDGRLDNHHELREQLNLPSDSSDVEVVVATFEQWGEVSFSKIVGDWSLALWEVESRILYLARDHAGTRSLYFLIDNEGVTWSDRLETFFTAKTSYSLDPDFAVCYLGGLSLRGRTPYLGIRSVLPGHYVALHQHMWKQSPHWTPLVSQEVRHRSDADYEAEFLDHFGRAVSRRVPGADPILAHLSGGMDSSSIVCMADQLSGHGNDGHERIHTVSFYDPSEPHWNELPYVHVVEEKRGIVGIHLETSLANRTFTLPASPVARLLPGTDSYTEQFEERFLSAVEGVKSSVILAGNGGDEVLGGVPTPLPELADYYATRRFGMFIRRAIQWCLADRSPLYKMALDTYGYVNEMRRPVGPPKSPMELLLAPHWASRCSDRWMQDANEVEAQAVLPSQVGNSRTWWTILEHLPHLGTGRMRQFEYRYPYLDRDLVTYLFSIPREQLVRPGRRRSLMRRALREIVPQAVLERRRKAFCIRGPLSAMTFSEEIIRGIVQDSAAVSLGYVNAERMRDALREIAMGKGAQSLGSMTRLLSFDAWVKQAPVRQA